jgi:hypothetical protein
MQDNQASNSHGSSRLSLARAICRYISLPNAFDQLAQLVPGGGGNTKGRNAGVVQRVVVCGLDIVCGEGREAKAEVGGNAMTPTSRRQCLCRGGLLPAPGFIKQVFYCGICGTCNQWETVSIYETSLVLKVTCGVTVAVIMLCGVVVMVAVFARCLLLLQPSHHIWCRGHGRCAMLCCGRGCRHAAWCCSCSHRPCGPTSSPHIIAIVPLLSQLVVAPW